MITHDRAIQLEHQVGRLYKCDRAGVSGLVDADYFEQNPFQAAILVIAYIYAHRLETSKLQYDEFLEKYEGLFEKTPTDDQVDEYIKEIKAIVEHYLK